MKEVRSLCTFGIGASCFVVFVMVFKPDAISRMPSVQSLRRVSASIARPKLRLRIGWAGKSSQQRQADASGPGNERPQAAVS